MFNRHGNRLARIIAAILVICLFQGTAASAYAHGSDTLQIVSAIQVGPYSLDVWASPGTLRTGEIHMETLLTTSSGLPVQGCDIQVTLWPTGQGLIPIVAQAGPSEIANAFRQEIILDIANPGLYRVELQVIESTRIVDEISFQIEVVQAAGWLKSIIYAEVLFSLIFGLWLLREGWLIGRARLGRPNNKHPDL